MLALAILLATPLAGGLVLALVGHRDNARDVNVAFSLATFIAACVLTIQIIEGDRKSTRLNSSHIQKSRMPSSA